MSLAIAIVVVTSYLSLGVELIFLHVRSVASSLNIFSPDPDLVATYSKRYQVIFRYNRSRKVLLFILPVSIIYALFAIPLIAIFYEIDPFNDYVFATALPSQAAGLLFICAGRSVSLASVLTIRANNRQERDSFFLHTSGLFRWSRNPGLLGMYVFAIGLWLITPSLTMAIGILVYVFYMDFKVRMEEDFLSNKFGQQYVSYRDRTGRYL